MEKYSVQIPSSVLAVQWGRLHAYTARSMGLIPGRGAKIPQSARCGQKKRNLQKLY